MDGTITPNRKVRLESAIRDAPHLYRWGIHGPDTRNDRRNRESEDEEPDGLSHVS